MKAVVREYDGSRLCLPLRAKRRRVFLCEGSDPFFGPVRDLVRAHSCAEANARFLHLHGIPSLKTQLEKKL